MTSRTFQLRCSFCGKEAIEVRKLITGPQVHICDECVSLCNEILIQDAPAGGVEHAARTHLKPKEIHEYLDEHIIGQDYAKKSVAVAVYNHYKRINSNDDEDVQLFKGNILMVGPTGTGKTAISQALAKLLDVPFVVTDATCLTEAGYVGEDVESIMKSLWIAADRDVERASRGIVVIDEIDKIGKRSGGGSNTRDVGGEGVQQALLKMIESDMVTIYPDGARTRPQKELIQIDTTHVLFILCGAFMGIEKIIRRRQSPNVIGFGSGGKRSTARNDDYNDLIRDVTSEDFIKYGLIPEFMGRVPVVVPFEELSREALYRILWEPKNSVVKQYKRLIEMSRVALEFTDGAMWAIVDEAISRKSGARGLRSIIENLMLEIMYDLPDLENVKTCVIHEGVLKKERPKLIYHDQAARSA
ncbi:ATP-dependent Clp protease ATP-binding subunit ClpX [Myxococcota bacterium]|nr:ATP-dependent Clp protease ATP-binding subunit ClpX [Myxococcota bacterium]MBU1431078.1 ATP-dependent Clp protease ATP-binding subunit ClpX [Myxococcota bacterium]MBU1896522.1 ATP-dependent Clp protease ATP-binding subunit ClpX [Myxococcota bacterium]